MQTEKVQRRNQFRAITVSAFPDDGAAAVRGARRGAAAARGVPRDAAARLPAGDRRRAGGTGQGVQGPRDGHADLDRDDLPCAGLPVQARHQADDRLRRDPVRRRRRTGGAVADGIAVRVHGLPRDCQPDWRHCQPHHRAVRLHRGHARAGRLAPGCAARRRHHAVAPGADHGRGDGHRALPAGGARRSALAAALLRADRRPDGGHFRHAAAGAGHLRHVRPGSETGGVAPSPTPSTPISRQCTSSYRGGDS